MTPLDRQTLVTLAIPNYNYARYLPTCIASALEQTHEKLEVLVADNASTDESCEILAGVRDPRLSWWRNERNLGVYPSWDRLFKRAQGRLFKILQADDWLEPAFVATCLEALNETQSDVALTGYRVTGEQERRVLPSDYGFTGRFVVPTRRQMAERIWSLTDFVHPTVSIVRRDLVPEGYGGTARHLGRDMVHWARAVTRGRTVLVNEVLAAQRLHPLQDRRRRDTSMGIGDQLDALDILVELDPVARPQLEAMARCYCTAYTRSAAAHVVRGHLGITANILRQLARHGRLWAGMSEIVRRPGLLLRDIRSDDFWPPAN